MVGDVRVAGPVEEFVGEPELGEGAGLARAGQSGDHQAAAGADRVPVEQDQPPAADHRLLDERGGDHEHAGVMVEPVLVTERALDRRQPVQPSRGQQDGWTWEGPR